MIATALVFFESGCVDFVADLANASSFLESQILSRLGYITIGLISPLTLCIDGLFWCSVFAVDLVTHGSVDTIHDLCTAQQNRNPKAFFEVFCCLPFFQYLKTLNPQAVGKNPKNGIWTNLFVENCFNTFFDLQLKSDIFLFKEVSTRITAAIGLLAVVILRIFDFAIGCLAATLSVLTVGKIEGINQTALDGLSSALVVYDIYNHLSGVVDPQNYLTALRTTAAPDEQAS